MIRVCPLEDLWQGEMRSVTVGNQKLVLVHVDGVVAAFHDRCAHLGVPISEGKLEGFTLTCRAHEWQYDARTGHGINPQSAALERVPLEIRDGHVWVGERHD